MAKIKLWGFNGSTYVRTVRMLLAEKGVSDYEQVPVNVLKGEPKQPEHLERHPFGKVPVVDVDGLRIIETPAILRYLNTVLPGPSLVPAEAKDVARADMVIGIIDSYGYNPIVGGVVGYHLFPEFVGGKDEAKHHEGLRAAHKVLGELVRIKGESRYLAGATPSIADLYLAPLVAYIAKTPHKAEFLDEPGLRDWWALVTARESFTATEP